MKNDNNINVKSNIDISNKSDEKLIIEKEFGIDLLKHYYNGNVHKKGSYSVDGLIYNLISNRLDTNTCIELADKFIFQAKLSHAITYGDFSPFEIRIDEKKRSVE